jgi:SAM-dependent methyltransferase
MTPIRHFLQHHVPHAMHAIPRAAFSIFTSKNATGISSVVQSLLYGFRRNISWLPLPREGWTWVEKPAAAVPAEGTSVASRGNLPDPTSRLVQEHLMDASRTGTVLDLGCGEGSNSIPLHLKGWDVIAIGSNQEMFSAYLQNVQRAIHRQGLCDGRFPHVITGDLVQRGYPKNMDAVVCVDVLPYIPPEHLQRMIDKIFYALRPGGKFVGTLFFRGDQETVAVTQSRLYAGKEGVRELLVRSGFHVMEVRERDAGQPNSPCLEFLASKAFLKREF